MSDRRRLLLVALIAFVAALAGAYLGRTLIARQAPVETDLHAMLHHDLNLDPRQHAQLKALEARFAVRHRMLELELRTDNAKLAAAIQADHGYGPAVAGAVDLSHRAMGALQKETLEHIFAMRGVLRPDQAARFDAAVVKALTAKEK